MYIYLYLFIYILYIIIFLFDSFYCNCNISLLTEQLSVIVQATHVPTDCFLCLSFARCSIFSLCSTSTNWCSLLAIFICIFTSSNLAALNSSSFDVTVLLFTLCFSTFDTLLVRAFGCHLSHIFCVSLSFFIFWIVQIWHYKKTILI